MRFAGALCAIIVILSATSAAASQLFVTFGNTLVQIDKSSGGQAGPFLSTGTSTLTGMAMRHADHVMFAVTSPGSTPCANCLATVNLTTGAVTPIGTGLGTALGDLAFSFGDTLYGVNPTGSQIYTVNTVSGVASATTNATGVAGSSGGGLSFGSGGNLFLLANRDNGSSNFVSLPGGSATVVGSPLTGSNCLVGGSPGCPVLAADVDPDFTPGQPAFYILSQGDPAVAPATFGGGGAFIGTLDPSATPTLHRIVGPNTIANSGALAFYTPAPASIPTLQQWALVALAGLFGASGLWWVRRRQSFSKVA